MTGIRRALGDDEGTTLVEFALVVPLVVLVLVACLDFARALNAYVTVANASREGARYAIVHPDADPAIIEAAIAARISPLDPSALTVSATYDDGSGPRTWPSGGIPQSPGVPEPMTIRIDTSYDWSATTWLVGSFFSVTGSRTFASSSSMETVR